MPQRPGGREEAEMRSLSLDLVTYITEWVGYGLPTELAAEQDGMGDDGGNFLGGKIFAVI
jgi:hypothetical protein